VQVRLGRGNSGYLDQVNLSPEFVEALRLVVGGNNVLAEDLASYGTDWTGRFIGSPSLVVRPGSTSEVSQVMHLCSQHNVAVVPQGGNTGLVGGTLADDGQIILSTSRINWIGSIDAVSQQISVGAGATVEQVQESAKQFGLRYAVDFGARGSAMIGGTIATNAGGINVLRYGSTRQQLVGIEAVLPNGDVIEHMAGLIKDNTGYDIASLLCGSEGTLGIVTAARLRLLPLHTTRTTVLLGCDSTEEVVHVVQRIRQQFDSLDAAELFYADGADLVAEAFNVAIPFVAPVYLLLEFSADVDLASDIERHLAQSNFAGLSAVAQDELGRARLWRLREEHTAAISTHGVPHKFDVTVAVSDLPKFIVKTRQRISETNADWKVFIFGHAADGNMHVNVLGPSATDELVDEVVLQVVAEFKGSISAEHGIGSAKKKWLSLSRSQNEIAMMKAIKGAIDPQGMMNPNTLFAM
jgi:FAD/FMN-containing dehydrogenase